MATAPALELDDLAHAFGRQPVFAGVTLAVQPGELVAVLGQSGSGKTTLLRSVAGLEQPSRGAIRLGDRTVSRDGACLVPTEERRVGLVFQDYALFPHLSVRDNVAFGLAGREPDRVDELLALVGLGALASRRPDQLSGGQQQRVALARALAPRPRLLLLDEPFANVDATLRAQLGAELQMIVRSQGTSALIVTHDRAEALALADRVAVLGALGDEAATLLQTGPPEEVYGEPSGRRVAELTGVVFFLPGQAAGERASTALGDVPLSRPVRGEIECVVRPEALAFEPGEDGDTDVVACQFQGGRHLLSCRTPAGVLTVEGRLERRPAPGTRGRVRIVRPCWPLVSGR